jgi:hypothetical protein
MPNKRGNQGYGKVEMIRQNFDKFSPRFWELMEAYSTSGHPEKERLFITEFNKIQTKMIPQELTGADGKDLYPIPILANPNVSTNNGDSKDQPTQQENTSDSRGNLSEQDNLYPTVTD